MDGLLGASKKDRHGVRDFLPLLMMCRHGLGVIEAVRVWRQDLNLGRARVWIRGVENGLSIEGSFAGNELGAFKRYLPTLHGALPWLFVSENVQSMNRRQYSEQQPPHAGAPGDVPLHTGVGSGSPDCPVSEAVSNIADVQISVAASLVPPFPPARR